MRKTWPFWLGIACLFLFTAWLFAMLSEARAHGPASWIMENPDFSWCCGSNDCAMIPADRVRVVQGGYLLLDTGEVIPEEKAKPSPDGEFWRCRYEAADPKSGTRCFFRAPPGS